MDEWILVVFWDLLLSVLLNLLISLPPPSGADAKSWGELQDSFLWNTCCFSKWAQAHWRWSFLANRGRLLINSLDSRSFNSEKCYVDVSKENTLLLINGHNLSAALDLNMYCFPIYSWIFLTGSLFMHCLFFVKSLWFLKYLWTFVFCSRASFNWLKLSEKKNNFMHIMQSSLFP